MILRNLCFYWRTSNFTITRMYRVLVTRDDVPQEAIDLLKQSCSVDVYSQGLSRGKQISRDELLERIKDKNALFCLLTEKIDAELLNAAGPSLKVIGTMSVGFDHIDLEACKKRKVLVGNTPGVLTDATAELTVALLLATSRRLMEASNEVTSGGWGRCAWSPLWMCGPSLMGSSVGIIGLGKIGFAVAQHIKAFKPQRITYCGNSPKTYADEIDAEFVSFEHLLKNSDFVICCCSLNEQTKGMFSSDAFKLMRKNAIFINTSRGKLVDHEALYEALVSGQIKAAGLDVTDPEPFPVDHKLTKLSNCVILPHIGSANTETRINMAMLTAKNILAGLENKPLPCPL